MKTDIVTEKKRTLRDVIPKWTIFIGGCLLLVIVIPIDFVVNLFLAPKIWLSIRDCCKTEFGHKGEAIWIASLPILIMICPFLGIVKDWFKCMKILNPKNG